MKLLFTLLVVSALTLKVDGATYDQACTDADPCSDANTACVDDGCGNNKCACSTNYVYDTTSTSCKLMGGQACTEATKANCISGECTDEKCEGTVANGNACTKNTDCASLNCKLDGTETCAEAASSTVMASLTLMLMTLVTTRFL